jgi:hypothetical protein
MTWLIWQQQRRQVAAVSSALGVVTVFLLVTGLHLASTYRSAVRSCATSLGGCANLFQTVFQGDNRLFDIIYAAGFLLPFVLGLFWGAPLVARELEEGTHRLAWTQGITRFHWLSAKLFWVFAAALVSAGLLTAITTWWFGPLNAVQMNRFSTVAFDTQGLVPIGYSFFGVAIGAMAGAVLRRTVVAMGSTLAILGVVRYVIDQYLRPHFLPAKSIAVSAATGFGSTPAGSGSWTLGETLVSTSGRVIATPGGKINPAAIPAACRPVFYTDSGLGRCLSTHGVHAVVSYQPASRYWPFQAIETSVYVLAAALIVGFAYWWVARRDA